jgi:hypothetical protein
MSDITQFTTEDLRADLADTIEDIVACQLALLLGVREYSGGSVHKRMDENMAIRRMITDELKRREASDGE